jgi:hypothetical protein
LIEAVLQILMVPIQTKITGLDVGGRMYDTHRSTMTVYECQAIKACTRTTSVAPFAPTGAAFSFTITPTATMALDATVYTTIAPSATTAPPTDAAVSSTIEPPATMALPTDATVYITIKPPGI